MTTIFKAALTCVEPYEGDSQDFCLYGCDERKLYELATAEVEKLYPGAGEWDWKGDSSSQTYLDDKGVLFMFDMYPVTLSC